jgi:FK506-binding nuclear protein
MSGLLPLASYNLELKPFTPQPCQAEDFPITVRITMASIDPEAVDEKKEPSTLRILKKSAIFADEGCADGCEHDSEDDDEDEDEEEQEETEEKKIENDEDSNDDDEDDDDDEVEDDEAIEEHVICTLSPKTQYQQSLDLTILPDEEVFFVVTGSYTIHLTGNYVDHPNDEDEDDYVYGTDEDDYDSEDDDEYDLTPDEDEIIDEEIEYDLDELDNVEDIEGKIEELIEEDEKNSKKREAESKSEAKESKKAKKEKSVKFNKDLEQGPTGPAAEKELKKQEKKETKKEEKKESKKELKKEVKKEEKKKPAVKTLPGGVIIEDKTVGTGPVCKKGQKVGVRYIGKLKNGKVFDKNTSGKPFHFGLGKGEVIKGWDVGVAGMAVGGERRIVIPAPMAYGSQKLPGIPANSELAFDVKLLSIK